MRQFEILEHKADLRIKVFGKTKEELFLQAVLAMEECMRYEIKKPKEKTIRGVEIKSIDLNSLLVDFLSEVLYLIQVNREIYERIKFEKLSDSEIKAELFGKKIERFGLDIKAVTYHKLNILQKKDGFFETEIIFDI
jgi:SHS2 domain-containing protein